jgi:hypothetical protein
MVAQTVEFEMIVRDVRKLSYFIKNCEALQSHSDTVLFKAKPKGIFILLTDFEGFCIVETRLKSLSENAIKLKKEEFNAKILLDSLIEQLKHCVRMKKGAVIRGQDNCLTVSPLTTNILKNALEVFKVKSTEHRPRVYYIVSTRRYVSESDDYIKFKIPNVELNKIITMQAIVSGSNGGVGIITVEPLNSTECVIKFSLKNASGSVATLKISTSTTSEDVLIMRMPAKKIEATYLVTYLKRSHNIFNIPTDLATVYVSAKGLVLHTDVRDGMSSVMFICNVNEPGKQIDLLSYA